jgi:hypothetical protein
MVKKEEKKSPKTVGFKPIGDDLSMIGDLVEFYQKSIDIVGVKVSASDVLRNALKDLHAAKIGNPALKYSGKK